MEKIRKTAKGIDIFLKVMQSVSAVFAVLCFGLMVLSFAVPDLLNSGYASDTIHSTLELDNVTVNLKAGEVFEGVFSKIIGINCIPLIVELAAAAVGCYSARKLLAPMKEGESPFTAGTHKNMAVLGWVVLAGGLLTSFAKQIAMNLTLGMVDLSQFFNTELVESVSVDYTLNLSPVIAALVIFLLAWIFKYGEDLQKESDETL